MICEKQLFPKPCKLLILPKPVMQAYQARKQCTAVIFVQLSLDPSVCSKEPILIGHHQC